MLKASFVKTPGVSLVAWAALATALPRVLAAAEIETGSSGSYASLLPVQVLAVLAAAHLCGWVAQAAGQPAVVGEMLAGVLLGPSLLGWLAPGLSRALFPPEGLAGVDALGQLGLMVFMFVVGLEVDLSEWKGRGRAVLLVSQASIAVPFLLGAGLAAYLYPYLSPPSVGFMPFVLFIGVAMSITAFPVLARILQDRGLSRTSIGGLAIACAATNDVAGWCLLALVVAASRQAAAGAMGWWQMAGASGLFLGAMFGFIRPLLHAWVVRLSPANDRTVAVALLTALAAAVVTQALGLHALFGAFLAGSIMPRLPDFRAALTQRLHSVAVVALLPMFFALAGLKARFDLVPQSGMWFYTALIVATAVTGKVIGTLAAARFSGLPWRSGLILGVLMNARGLMELVVLKIGLDIGVISPAVYSMMVIMTLATTLMTGPVLNLLRDRQAADEWPVTTAAGETAVAVAASGRA